MRTETHSCGARWERYGERRAHCAGCHRTFSSTAMFDVHRASEGDQRVCLDPATVFNKKGEPVFEARVDRAGATIWGKPAGDVAWFQSLKDAKNRQQAL